MRHPTPTQHEAIQRFFDLIASGLMHHNPLAICAFLLMLWIPIKLMSALLAPPRYRSSITYYPPPARLQSPPRRPAAPPRPPRPQRPASHDGEPHPDYCPCRPCRDYAVAVAEWEAAATGSPARTLSFSTSQPARMPEPSDDIAPAVRQCRHEHVRPVYAGGEMMRYICANGWCDGRWAPTAEFPPGVVLPEQED